MTIVTALVLGAGSSSRLGQPKQLLEYRGRPLLQTAIDNALAGPFDQVVVALGGAADEVRQAIDPGWAKVVENLTYTDGCSSSIVASLDAVDVRSDGVVLLLGDQPGVSYRAMGDLVQRATGSPLGVCRYDDGLGHPFWLGRSTFDDLRSLHGDKGVWQLIESGRHPVTEIPVAGPIPHDVDTWEDYKALLDADR